METLKRNRAVTIQRIVDALEQLLAEVGLSGLSINAIAEKAAVSKVLIYRYFGNLEGLLEYYVRQGYVVPHYSPAWLEQIRPAHAEQLASIWSNQVLQLYRRHRASPSIRELLKATVQENTILTQAISKTLDGEMTRLVNQYGFVKGVNQNAISAIILGGLSYLTIQAQLDHSVIGLDLRSEADWQQIEEAVQTIFKGLNELAMRSSRSQFDLKASEPVVTNW